MKDACRPLGNGSLVWISHGPWGAAPSLCMGRECKVTMRFLLRAISLIALALAVIAGVIDAIKSVAASQVVISPLGAVWFGLSPDTLNLAQAVIQRNVHPYLWDPVVQWILLQPAWAVFLVLSLFFYLIAWRRPKPAGRFAAR